MTLIILQTAKSLENADACFQNVKVWRWIFNKSNDKIKIALLQIVRNKQYQPTVSPTNTTITRWSSRKLFCFLRSKHRNQLNFFVLELDIFSGVWDIR